ncbi:hypothetical protein BHE74_00043196 [Ensete ventricosum]|uniref:Uncharacterized protein n=1 Tax=Ensete ventricosum TaxID=4639 RepID=A0A445MKA6_ENSVE|nr:hypothetical protein BHE74_00043196 [Ensete ventricosum]RZR74643.1 hypothetical protein BHM03_00040330 [Ensete ventricosum]
MRSTPVAKGTILFNLPKGNSHLIHQDIKLEKGKKSPLKAGVIGKGVRVLTGAKGLVRGRNELGFTREFLK